MNFEESLHQDLCNEDDVPMSSSIEFKIKKNLNKILCISGHLLAEMLDIESILDGTKVSVDITRFLVRGGANCMNWP